MALYGGARDMSLFRNINREIMHNIISQQCVLYKYDLSETKVNIYGEAASEKYYHPPVLLYCLIDIPNQEYSDSGFGPDFNWSPTFKFLRDDLQASTSGSCDENNDNPNGANIVPDVGDIIMYQNAYFQIDNVNMAQFFVGKDPDYPFTDADGNNPLETDLNEFGYNVAVVCQTFYVPADKVQIQLARF
jgi:hypothetical protein